VFLIALTKQKNLILAVTVALLTLFSANLSAEESHRLDGRWVMMQQSTTVATVPVLGDIFAKSLVVSLHDARHRGGRLKGKGRVCQLRIDSGTRFVKTILPAAFRRSLPPPLLNARILDKGGKLQLLQSKRTIVVGARLKDKKRDTMPSTASDPRVFDQDGDGKPGVTIQIGGIVSGKIYVVQRSWTRLFGSEQRNGEFVGKLKFGNEQVILGATSSRLKSKPISRPVPSKSWFRLLKVPASSSCNDARRIAKRWFK
jgi:hypothetical protein